MQAADTNQYRFTSPSPAERAFTASLLGCACTISVNAFLVFLLSPPPFLLISSLRHSTRVTQDLNVSPIYDGRFWNPPQKHQFKNPRPIKEMQRLAHEGGVKIYEAHGAFLRSWVVSSSHYVCSNRHRRSRYLDARGPRWHIQGV